MCLLTFNICTTSDQLLPVVDTMAVAFTLITSIAVAVTLSAMAKTPMPRGTLIRTYLGGRTLAFLSASCLQRISYALGVATSMAEECTDPEVQVLKAISSVPIVGGVIGLIFVLPICFRLPRLEEIAQAPYGQTLPYFLYAVTGAKAAALAPMILAFMVTLFC